MTDDGTPFAQPIETGEANTASFGRALHLNSGVTPVAPFFGILVRLGFDRSSYAYRASCAGYHA
jgi:hypothetical protein